jgi:L-threonylcarbamoyladenylate synthase
MKTSVVEQSNPQSAEIAREVLLAGGVIAIPTDTVYGIACLVNKRESIQRLYAIKERELIKAIPVLIGTLEQISSITDSFSSSANMRPSGSHFRKYIRPPQFNKRARSTR